MLSEISSLSVTTLKLKGCTRSVRFKVNKSCSYFRVRDDGLSDPVNAEVVTAEPVCAVVGLLVLGRDVSEYIMYYINKKAISTRGRCRKCQAFYLFSKFA